MLAAHLFGAIVAVLALTGARGDSVLCSDSAPTSVYFYVPHRMRNDPKASDFQGAMQQLGNAVFRGDGKVTFSYNVYDGTQTNQVGTATDASAFGGLVTFGDAQTYDDTQSIYHPLGHFNSVVSSPSDTRFQAVIFTYDNDTTSNPQQIIDLRNQIEAKHAVITTVVMRSPLQWTPPYSSVPTDTFVYTGHKFNDTVMALASSSPVTAHMHIVDDMEAFYYGYATRLGASLYAFSSVESQVYGDGSCTVFGDPHVITPTGHMYSFQGYGTYDLLRPLKPNGGGHRLRVEAMFGPCAFPSVASDVNSGADGAYYGWTKATCLNGVAFTNGQDVMEVRYRGSETFLMVRMNGIEMPSWEYAWGNQAHTIGMKIMTAAKGPEKAAGGPTGIGNTGLSGDGTEMIALAYFKDGNDYVTLEVAFAQNGAALRMWPSPSLQTRVGGLCGSFSRCRAKDLVSSSGLMVSSPVSLEKAEGPNFHPMPSNHPDPFKYDVGRSDQLSLMAGYHQRLYDFAQSWKVTDGETIFFNLPAERQIVPQQFTPDINPNAPSSTGVCNGLTGWLLWVCQYDVKTTGRSELAWASTWIAEHVCADYCQFGRRQRGGSFVAADIQLIDPTSCACRDFEDLDLHTGYGSSNLPPHMLEGVTLPHAFARLPLGGTYKFERYPGGQQVELKVACHQVVGVANAGDDFTVARSSFFTSPYTGTERDNNYVKLRGSASTVIQRQFQFSWRLVNYTPLQGGEAELPYAGDIRFVVSPVVHGENRRVAHFKPRYPGVYEWELALYDGCRITTDRVKVTVACPSCTTKAAFKAPPTANLLWTGKSFETDFYVPVPTSALPFVRYSIARPATPMTEMADGVTASGDLEVRHDVSACHEENLKSTSVGVGTSSMSYTLVRVLDTCATSTGPNVPVSYTQIHPSDASGEFSTKLVAQYPTRSFDNMGITYEHWHYSTYNLANWNVTMKDQLIEELCDITMSYSMESNITSSWKRAAIPAQVHVTATPRSGDPKDCMAHYNFVATMWDGCQFSTVDQTQTMVMPRCPSRSIARINCSDADTTVFYGQGNPGYKPVMLTADQTFTSSLSYSVQKLNYEWKVTQAPEASLMLGTKWTGQAVSFIPDVDGEYIITLYADDGCSVGIQDTIKITAHCNQDTALTSTVTMSAPTFTDGMTITTDPSGPTDNLRTVYKWFFNTTSQSVMNPYSVRIPPATSSQWPSTLLNGNGLYGAKVYLQNGCQGIVKTVQNTLSATPPTLSYNFLKSRYTFQVDTGAYEMIKAKPTFSSSSFVYTDSYFNITYTDGNHGTLAATFDGDNWVGQPMNAGVYTLVLSGNDTKNFVSAAQTSTEVGCFDYPDPAIHYNVTHDGDTTEDGDIFPGDVVVFNIRVANEPFSHPLRFQKYEWTLVSADGKVVWNQISSSPTASFNAETPGDYVMQTRAALPSQCLPPKFLTEYLPAKEYSVFTNYDFPAYNTSFTVKCGRTPLPSYNLASETSLSTAFDGARFPGVTLANVGSSCEFLRQHWPREFDLLLDILEGAGGLYLPSQHHWLDSHLRFPVTRCSCRLGPRQLPPSLHHEAKHHRAALVHQCVQGFH